MKIKRSNTHQWSPRSSTTTTACRWHYLSILNAVKSFGFETTLQITIYLYYNITLFRKAQQVSQSAASIGFAKTKPQKEKTDRKSNQSVISEILLTQYEIPFGMKYLALLNMK